jgi:hypothetical protein
MARRTKRKREPVEVDDDPFFSTSWSACFTCRQHGFTERCGGRCGETSKRISSRSRPNVSQDPVAQPPPRLDVSGETDCISNLSPSLTLKDKLIQDGVIRIFPFPSSPTELLIQHTHDLRHLIDGLRQRASDEDREFLSNPPPPLDPPPRSPFPRPSLF